VYGCVFSCMCICLVYVSVGLCVHVRVGICNVPFFLVSDRIVPSLLPPFPYPTPPLPPRLVLYQMRRIGSYLTRDEVNAMLPLPTSEGSSRSLLAGLQGGSFSTKTAGLNRYRSERQIHIHTYIHIHRYIQIDKDVDTDR
jgi:hypothetical protein